MESSAEPKEKKPYPKTSVGLQRMKLEKLMEKPHVPVDIPDPPRSKKFPNAPDFVRNVMGSSAGAGSGEFHVYRHIRRREQMRQKWINDQAEQLEEDVEYHRKLEENQRKADERTAKKRAKRLKKKQKMIAKKLKGESKNTKNSTTDEESEYSDVEDKSACDHVKEHEPRSTETAVENIGEYHTEERKETEWTISNKDKDENLMKAKESDNKKEESRKELCDHVSDFHVNKKEESDEQLRLNSDNRKTNGEQVVEKTKTDNDNNKEDKS